MSPIDPDYVGVPERIQLFYARFPDGRLCAGSKPRVVTVGDRTFIWYHARAYRTPDDPRPGEGWVQEPIPGPTSFTRDSELMNAETSAWGRAIVAVGVGANKKIASAEEIMARTGDAASALEAKPNGKITKDQHARIGALCSALADLSDPEEDKNHWASYSRGWVKEQYGKTTRADLTKQEAHQLIEHLAALEKSKQVPFG